MTNRQVFRGLIQWETQTDADGRFVWYDAPVTGKFYLDVFKPNFPPECHAVVRPEAGEVTLTMAH